MFWLRSARRHGSTEHWPTLLRFGASRGIEESRILPNVVFSCGPVWRGEVIQLLTASKTRPRDCGGNNSPEDHPSNGDRSGIEA